MTSVVCDTNILISAFIFPGGNPDAILEKVHLGEVRLFVSEPILVEFEAALRRKFELNETRIAEFVNAIRGVATVVQPTEVVRMIEDDAADNRILECAKAAGADYLITGDKKHLIPLKQFGKTIILSATEFLLIFKHTGK
jgi:putative PIN family toxin of toxin-antitoxin system